MECSAAGGDGTMNRLDRSAVTPSHEPDPDRDRVVSVRNVRYEPGRSADSRGGGEASLALYAAMVIEGRWMVASVAVLALALAAVYLFLATPVYEARSVVQVEHRQRTAAGLNDLSTALGESPPSEPEIEIIRSRMLLGTIVDELHLDVEVEPRAVVGIGKALSRRYRGQGLAAPLLGFSRFAWGGERIQVEQIDVRKALLGEPLLLTVREGGAFGLSHEGAALLEGTVGKLASAGEEQLVVSELVARPGTQIWVTKRNREHVIDALQKELRVQEKGRRSGIITIELDGVDPRRISGVVNAVATAYLRQNVEQRSAEAAKTLEFLETQIPKVKANVDAAEAALNAFRVRTGSVDTTAETRTMLDRMAELDKEIADAEVRRSELRQSFTEQHPNLLAVANKLALLRSEAAALSGRMRSLPLAELNSARLARELRDATDLYVTLLNRAQELRVAKSGTIGDVRIIDRAHISDTPARPNRGAVLVITLLLGLAGGVAAAILRRSLVKRAEGPDDVEAATGVPVYVTVPHSDAQAELARAKRHRRGAPQAVLAEAAPEDVVVETMRSLRTSLQFALVESRNNIVAMTGPAPGIGKSFLAVNLAYVLGSAGKRVLLVDCDLRRGGLHRQFGLARQPGVSDVVSGAVSLDEAIRKAPSGPLFVLPTGRIPPNPAELLSSQRFEALLQEASARFELVIVDTPPLLAVSDAMLVARFAGVNFLVLRAGMHTSREIALSVKQFALNGIKLHGSILNDVRVTRAGRYERDGYVRYAYSSDAKE